MNPAIVVRFVRYVFGLFREEEEIDVWIRNGEGRIDGDELRGSEDGEPRFRDGCADGKGRDREMREYFFPNVDRKEFPEERGTDDVGHIIAGIRHFLRLSRLVVTRRS